MCGWCDARTRTINKGSFDLGIYHLLSTTNYLEYSVKLLSCYHPPTVLLRHFANSDGKVQE